MTGTSFTHEKRGSMTGQRALRIFEAGGGRCAGPCGRKLFASDDWHVDHIIALENGGTDDDTNLQILCGWCHKPKTADDHALAGHGRRMAVNAFVPKEYRGTGKGWRKRK